MIDVIFILLAFFLSVSQIKKSTVKVDLPEVTEAVATGEKLDEGKPVRKILQISRDGTLYLGEKKMEGAASFFRVFDAEIEEDRAAGRPVVVEIITDKEARNGILVDVINHLNRKKIRRLEILAVERDPSGR
jgi:biopolymer transport protein ExbD